MDSANTLKIVTLNVNGMSDPVKRRKVLSLINQHSAQVFFLQETHVRRIEGWAGLAYTSYGGPRTAGVAILFKRSLMVKVDKYKGDSDGRLLSVEAVISGTKFNFLSVYAPNEPAARRFFYNNDFPTFFSNSAANIIAGDFNCVDSLGLDTLNHSPASMVMVGSRELNGAIEELDLIDSFRVACPDNRQFTWSNKQGSQASRLDRIFAPAAFEVLRHSTEIFPYSDHKSVSLELGFKGPEPEPLRPSTWKLNVSFLEDKNYVKKIKNLINDCLTIREGFANVCDWWDDLKRRVKLVSVSHCSHQKRAEEHRVEEIKALIGTEEPGEEIARLKDELRSIEDKRLLGLAIRSRVQRELYDEKCSSFFFNSIRKRRAKNRVEEVRDEEGNIVTDQAQIVQVYERFYQSLYTKHEQDQGAIETLLESSPRIQNTDDTQALTFQSVRVKEVLGRMQRSRTPGPDGLPMEFYVTFFDDLSVHLVELFSFMATENVVPTSMNQAVTVLLQKDGDKADPKNQRPISLLNVDYKIVTKYINEIFFPSVLDKCVTQEQLCAVKGRSIHDGLLLIRDTIEYSQKAGGQGKLMSLDQRKAFDMVDHDLLFLTLRHMGTPIGLVELVKTLYKGVTTRVQVNGHQSREIDIQRGVRQGCPLSPTLYIVYAQVFINHLKSDEGVRGITTPGGDNVKVSAYADDLLVFCKDNLDIEKTFQYFEKVRLLTGSALNTQKTEILNLDRRVPTGSTFEKEHIKVCGILFSVNSIENNTRTNEKIALDKMTGKIDKIERMGLSLKGKVLLLNTLFFAQFFYLSGVYMPTADTIKKATKAGFSYLWGAGRREMIARKVVETPKELGGMGLVKLKEKCQSLHLAQNLFRPCSDEFSHPRKGLYKYLYGFWARKFAARLYSNSEPHSFELSDAYRPTENTRLAVWTELDKSGLSAVSSRQTYAWLIGAQKLVQPKIPENTEEETVKRLCVVWRDGLLPTARVDFMWRLAMGGVKTGDVIARYHIPGSRVSCMFCPAITETAEHLFSRCRALASIRGKVQETVVSLGCTVDPTCAEEVRELFCLGLTPHVESKRVRRDVFNLISGTNIAVWKVRNEVLFSSAKDGVAKVNALVVALSKRMLDSLNELDREDELMASDDES